jgi:hypothetical protein
MLREKLKKAGIQLFYNRKARFIGKQFQTLLTVLSEPKFLPLPLNDFRKIKDSSRVVVGMRKDVDCNPWQALKMAEVENKQDIYSTYFILSTAYYAGKIKKGVFHRDNLDSVYKKIHSLGNEIAIHNDLLTVVIKYGMDPIKFTYDELSYYAILGFPIHGTSSHGSEIAKQTFPNFEMFSDFAKRQNYAYKGAIYPIGRYSLSEYTFKYEATHLNHTCYISDAGGTFKIDGKPAGFDQVICRLMTAQKGERIQLLLHPVWWRLK